MSWQFVVTLALLVSYSVALVAVIHVWLCSRHPQAALGWTVAILALPVVGSLAYFLFGINRVDSRAAKLMSAVATRRTFHILHDREELAQHLPPYRFSTTDHAIIRVGNEKHGSMPRMSGNTVTPLFNGDECYPKVLEAINAAQHEVFMCTFICQGDIYAKAITDAMAAAHERGVKVRVIVDGLGTFLCRSKPWRDLAKIGPDVRLFFPPRLIPPQMSINLRNHRKVLVCDEIGFTGGMNIADYHVMASDEPELVQDLHFLCEGPIVSELREAFLMDWAFVTGKDVGTQFTLPEPKGTMDCRVVLDGPGTHDDPLQDLLSGVFSCARHSIKIFTPYFLPPREMIGSLISAAARGVEVKVCLPSNIDHIYVEWACNRMLPRLLENGVRVFRQPGPFAHTKLILIDELYVCLGSTNLDPRSLSLNFELNMEVFAPELNARLQTYADDIFARSEEICLTDLRNRPLLIRLRDAGAWIFSPYM